MERARRVLLVEDDRADQYFFLLAVKDMENISIYAVANNGREALERLKHAIDLADIIVTDINMPVMDGIECLSEIVKDPIIKNIPVVVLSSDISEINNVREIGARAFIKKQSDYLALRQHLQHVINIDFEKESHLAEQTFATALGI